MMKNILVFGGSTSSTSINKQLATYASSFIKNAEVKIIDLSDFPCPIYDIDDEMEHGFPEKALEFVSVLNKTDGLIISTSEHNANITAALKNILDWASRINIKCMEGKNVLLLSTSPGGYGGQNALNIAAIFLPKLGAKITDKYALPKFNENFADGAIKDETLNKELIEKVNAFDALLA